MENEKLVDIISYILIFGDLFIKKKNPNIKIKHI
jgi:hypothetical protein